MKRVERMQFYFCCSWVLRCIKRSAYNLQLKRIRFGIFETISAIITPFLDQGSTLKPEKIQWFPNVVKTDLTIKKPHHRAISKAKSMRRVKSHQNHYMKKVSIFLIQWLTQRFDFWKIFNHQIFVPHSTKIVYMKTKLVLE